MKNTMKTQNVCLFLLLVFWLVEDFIECDISQASLYRVFTTPGTKNGWVKGELRKELYSQFNVASIGITNCYFNIHGNIHPNPGLIVTYPCGVCNSKVKNCDSCQRWCRSPKCAWMNDDEYRGHCSDFWMWPACCLPSLDRLLFDSSTHADVEASNSFLFPTYPNSVSIICPSQH